MIISNVAAAFNAAAAAVKARKEKASDVCVPLDTVFLQNVLFEKYIIGFS